MNYATVIVKVDTYNIIFTWYIFSIIISLLASIVHVKSVVVVSVVS